MEENNNVGRPRKAEELKRKVVSVSLPNWMLVQLRARATASTAEQGEEISASKVVEIALREQYGFRYKTE